MADWIETYRGVVNAWECDIVEHFTIAYYFDRFADATRNFVYLIGETETLGPAVNVAPTRLFVTFRHELRAGTQFHILSAVIGVDDTAARFGHKVINSTTQQAVTTVVETIALAPSAAVTRRKLEALVVASDGAKVPEPSAGQPGAGLTTLRDRVKPWEIGESGSLSLPGYVHRFSAAAMQTLAGVGMSGAYLKENHRGFSTFELDLHIANDAKLGDIIDATTVVTHLGSSSVRFLHTLVCQQSGSILATMTQGGVHLDMAARKSTPMPPELRALASKIALDRQ